MGEDPFYRKFNHRFIYFSFIKVERWGRTRSIENLIIVLFIFHLLKLKDGGGPVLSKILVGAFCPKFRVVGFKAYYDPNVKLVGLFVFIVGRVPLS